MNMTDKEAKILKAFYDKKYNDTKIDVVSFGLESMYEAGFLYNLIGKMWISFFTREPFRKAGMADSKYNNRVVSIWWEYSNYLSRRT